MNNIINMSFSLNLEGGKYIATITVGDENIIEVFESEKEALRVSSLLVEEMKKILKENKEKS